MKAKENSIQSSWSMPSLTLVIDFPILCLEVRQYSDLRNPHAMNVAIRPNHLQDNISKSKLFFFH